jgi:hypothetical protein
LEKDKRARWHVSEIMYLFVLIDWICSMTERECIEEAQLYPHDLQSTTPPCGAQWAWFRHCQGRKQKKQLIITKFHWV